MEYLLTNDENVNASTWILLSYIKYIYYISYIKYNFVSIQWHVCVSADNFFLWKDIVCSYFDYFTCCYVQVLESTVSTIKFMVLSDKFNLSLLIALKITKLGCVMFKTCLWGRDHK